MHIPCRFRLISYLPHLSLLNSSHNDSNLNDHALLTFVVSRNKKHEVALAHFERHR